MTVRGTTRTWGFAFDGDPRHLAAWRADGLDVTETVNVIPDWVPGWAVGAWCAMQDVWNLR